MDSGTEPIADATDLDRVRRQARQVRRKALLLGVALTVLVTVLSLIG